jgi:aminopeptidase N
MGNGNGNGQADADSWREEKVTVTERSHTFELPLPARPTQMIFDPGDVTLKSLKLDKPRPLWLRQLQAAPLGVDRILAANALGDQPSPEITRALGKALIQDQFWAVRAAAARALGKVQGDEARALLEAGRSDRHPKVRRAVAAALGEFLGDAIAGRLLSDWAEGGDPSVFVEATAALALGRCRAAGAVTVLPRLLDRNAYQDVIRWRALEGLGWCGDERAVPLLEAAYVPEASFQARRAVVAAMARLCEGTASARRARELLERALGDRDFRVRMEAASGLITLGDSRSIPALERAARAELDGRAKRRLREAVVDIVERGAAAEQSRKVGAEVERLRRELLDMRQRLEKIEQRGEESSTPAKRGVGRTNRRPRPPSRRGAKPGRRR